MLAVSLLVVLAGCGGDDEQPNPEPEEAATDWQPTSDVPTGPGPNGLTRPGAVIPVGTPGLVPYEGIAEDSVEIVEVTVPESEAVTETDASQLPDDTDLEGDQYYYVNYRIRTVDGSMAGEIMVLDAIDATGESMDTWGSTAYEPCSAQIGLTEGPQAVCLVAAGDHPPAALGWENHANDPYDDNPVLWELPG